MGRFSASIRAGYKVTFGGLARTIRRSVRNASFTAAESGNAGATPGASSTMTGVALAKRRAYLLTTAFEKSYSGDISFASVGVFSSIFVSLSFQSRALAPFGVVYSQRMMKA